MTLATVPEAVQWIGALSGAAAVLLTTTVIVREWLSRRRDQASRISAWADLVTPLRAATDDGLAIGPGPGKSVRVQVRNTSDAPVYDFRAWVHANYARDAFVMGTHERQILPPGVDVVWADWVELPEGGLAGKPYVDLTFQDEHGRRWERRYDGGLGPDYRSPYARKRKPLGRRAWTRDAPP